jgi:hypothetical protein
MSDVGGSAEREERASASPAVASQASSAERASASQGRDNSDVVEPDLADLKEPTGKGSIITLTTVIALLLATALTVLGIGAADNAVANVDASSWLWSSTRGEVDRVNGVTARVDTRTRVKDAQNHEIQISQTDKYLILRDLSTGEVSALDLTTLQINAVLPTTPGLGVSVALHGETAFVIDSVQGQVRQLDPRSLAPVGDSITLPNGIMPGGFDGKGALWIAVPTEGTVVAINPGANGVSPKVLRTVTVADPGHDLILSTLDDGVAVLDNTTQSLGVVKGDKVDVTTVPVDKPAILPTRTSGSAVPVTVAEDRAVIVVDGKKVVQFTVPGTGDLSAAVSFAGHVYCADPKAGVVYEFDAKGALVNQIRIPSAGGALELEVREGFLFINAPDGSTARVVNDKHVVREVNKYSDGVLGGDPPPPPPPTQQPKPQKTVPGKPQNVTASAGDASAMVTWRKATDNGSAITKYVIEGGPAPITVGANQRSAQITGLTNAKPYKFSVYAVNAIGAGPKATSPVVTPTADVPDAPASASATAKPDGTVVVTWPAANGQGRKITSYTVTSVTAGVQAPVGSVTGTSMTIAKGSLAYGTQVAFTVVAINDRNAGSKPSPLSNTVVPYTTPGPPRNVSAATVTDQRGAVRVTWQPAVDNGRKIDKYVVDGGKGAQDVTGTTVTLNGFADDAAVDVTVHAVNEAGKGPDVKVSARTIGVPTITLTGSGAGYNSVSVTFTPNSKGGAATCAVRLSTGAGAQVGCGTAPVTLTVGGLWPNNTYSFTASVTTAVGTAQATGSQPTSQLRATVLCGDTSYCGSGIYIYSVPNQSNPSNAVGRFTAGNQFVPQCHRAADDVDASPWGGRHTNQWLQLTYRGQTAWFPYAWANIDTGNINTIPAC